MTSRAYLALGAAALLSAATAAPARADNAKLDVKPGLWEITYAGTSNGKIPLPPDVAANLTPEQRQRIEAAQQAQLEQMKQPHTAKMCLTPAQLAEGFKIGPGNQPGCKDSVVSSTPNAMHLREECTSISPPRTVDVNYQAPDRQTVNSTLHVVVGSGPQAMVMDRTMHGKWLAADCGNVQPGGPAQ
jgi:hypothetical protein